MRGGQVCFPRGTWYRRLGILRPDPRGRWICRPDPRGWWICRPDPFAALLAPQVLFVIPRIHDGVAAADVDHLRRQLVHEVAIVRHEDQRAAEVLERLEQ